MRLAESIFESTSEKDAEKTRSGSETGLSKNTEILRGALRSAASANPNGINSAASQRVPASPILSAWCLN
jgi:hypothetical protein